MGEPKPGASGARAAMPASASGEAQLFALLFGDVAQRPVAAPLDTEGEWRIPFRSVLDPPDDVLERVLHAAMEESAGVAGMEYSGVATDSWILVDAADSDGRVRDPGEVAAIVADFSRRVSTNLDGDSRDRLERIVETRLNVDGRVEMELAQMESEVLARALLDISDESFKIIESLNSPDNPPANDEHTFPDKGTVAGDGAGERHPAAVLAQALGTIALSTQEIEEAKVRLDAGVEMAREMGATWSQIGEAAGISQQAATERWNPQSRKRRLERQRQQAAQRLNS